MKPMTYICPFCGLTETDDVAVATGWEPYWWTGNVQHHKPTCPDCANKFIDFTNEKDGGNLNWDAVFTALQNALRKN